MTAGRSDGRSLNVFLTNASCRVSWLLVSGQIHFSCSEEELMTHTDMQSVAEGNQSINQVNESESGRLQRTH